MTNQPKPRRLDAFCTQCDLLAEYNWATQQWNHVAVPGSIREHFPVTVGWLPKLLVKIETRRRRKLLARWANGRS